MKYMTSIIFLLSFCSATADHHFDMSFSTQSAIIEALIYSNEAQNDYVYEGSFGAFLERDLKNMISGRAKKENSVVLTCDTITKRLLNCTLISLNERDEVSINGVVHLSRELLFIKTTNITTNHRKR